MGPTKSGMGVQGVLYLKREKLDLECFLNDKTDLSLWNLGFSTTCQVMKAWKGVSLDSQGEREE